MGVRIKMPNINADEYAGVLRAKLYAIMEETIRFAVEEMKRLSGDSMSGESKREISGDMIAAMDGEVFTRGMDVIVGKFGFTGKQQLYYFLQTSSGFLHAPDSSYIEPSFAMRDAFVQAVELLQKRLAATF